MQFITVPLPSVRSKRGSVVALGTGKVTQREAKMDTLLVVIILVAFVFGFAWVLRRWL